MKRKFLWVVLFGMLGMEILAQTPANYYENLHKQILEVEAIPTSPLYVLPSSDCKLDLLERRLEKDYDYRLTDVPPALLAAFRVKRRQIDFMRSHIDSLFYMQALALMNASPSQEKEAMKYVEHSLQYHPFYGRSVLFKLSWLMRQKAWRPCLEYLNTVIDALGYKAEFRNFCNSLYWELLNRMEACNRQELYKDAIDLFDLMQEYIGENVPVTRVEYREKNLLYAAFQGQYFSIVRVAERAFSQRQYQLANQYALRAYEFYRDHEQFMDGINTSLSLLDQLYHQFSAFQTLSDEDERMYYQALMDEILDKTRLVPSPSIDFNPQHFIREELAFQQASGQPPVEEPVQPTPSYAEDLQLQPAEPQPLPKMYSRLSSRQARWKLHRVLDSSLICREKRRFYESFRYLQAADSLMKDYRLEGPQDFGMQMRSTVVLATEQLLNKSQYYLWKNDLDKADSLYALGKELSQIYQQPALPEIDNLMGLYEAEKQRVECRKQQKIMDSLLLKTDWDLKNTGWSHAGATWKAVLEVRNRQVACNLDTVQFHRYGKIVEEYRRFDSLYALAGRCLQVDRDTLAFVRLYSGLDRQRTRSSIEEFLQIYPTLFSRLSFDRDYRSLHIWAEYAFESKDYSKCRYLLSYLQQEAYSAKALDKLRKKLRKAEKQ